MAALDSIRNIIGTWKPKGGLEEKTADNAVREATFVTWEALVTFPVSTSAITVIWRVLQSIDPNSTTMKSMLVPLILSFLLGIAFFLLDITDKHTTDRSVNTIIRKLLLAVVNTFFLAAAALGIDSAVLSSPAVTP